MNCKPGDLAVVIRIQGHDPADRLFIGRVLTVIAPSPIWADSWLTEPQLWGVLDGVPIHWADTSLRPIRDNDGTDETLTWAGKPEGVTA
jgi:hypothetical protein